MSEELDECTNAQGDVFHRGDRIRFRAEWNDKEVFYNRDTKKLHGTVKSMSRGGEYNFLYVSWTYEKEHLMQTVSADWVEPYAQVPFEVIINELVEKPEIKATFPVLRKYKNGEVDLANHKDNRTITIWPNGDTNFLGLIELTAAQLAAISAACTEIAANYQAEHGKEEAWQKSLSD